ncbi:MAG: putative lipoprotein, partial [Pseudonocardiales bacterium]|nr:putative lipoprotein [Pseudonocardiales bacterium]
PVGLAVTAGLAVRALELLAARRKAARGEEAAPSLREIVAVIPRARLREYTVLLSISGLVAWCVYLQVEFGDALAWIHVQAAPGWNQGSGLHTWLKIDFAGTLVKGPMENILLLTPQALASAAAVLLIPRVRRLFGWGYAVLAAGILAIAIVGTKDFMGTGRYALAAFPVIAAGGDLLATRTARWAVPVALGLSGAGLVVASIFYSRGYAVS